MLGGGVVLGGGIAGGDGGGVGYIETVTFDRKSSTDQPSGAVS